MHHHQSKGYDETLTDVLKIQKSEVETPRFPFIKCYFQSLDIHIHLKYKEFAKEYRECNLNLQIKSTVSVLCTRRKMESTLQI